MATLTETAYYTKKFIAGAVFLLIFVFVAKLSLNYYQAHQASQIPPPTPTPAPAFGKLPALKLPAKDSQVVNFRIETVNGKIPEMATIEKVYFIPPRPAYTFFTKERALSFGRKFGFTNEPVVLSGEEYRWTDPELLDRTFSLNIFTNNFTLDYKFANDPTIFSDFVLPKKREAESFARSYLSSRNVMPENLSKGEITSEFLVFDGQNIKKALNLSEANLIQVDFLRKNINELPVLTKEHHKGLVSFLISGAKDKKKKILKLEYILWLVDSENTATYPLKTGEEAFEELKIGGGAIISGGQQTTAAIRNVYLAYLDTKEYQAFLQPIFVFEGDGRFVAYVAAVKEEWTE